MKSRFGADGVLSLNVPVGPDDANREVIVTVEPANEIGRPPETSLEEWRRFLEETAGAWEGEPFVRPPQGEFEKRRELD